MVPYSRPPVLPITIAAALVLAMGLGLGESRALVHDARPAAVVRELRGAPIYHASLTRQAGGSGLPSGSSPIGPPTTTPPAAIPLDGNSWESQQDPSDLGISQSWGQGGAPPGGWSPVSIPNDFNP